MLIIAVVSLSASSTNNLGITITNNSLINFVPPKNQTPVYLRPNESIDLLC